MKYRTYFLINDNKSRKQRCALFFLIHVCDIDDLFGLNQMRDHIDYL